MVIRVAVARATGKLGSIVGDLVADDPELELTGAVVSSGGGHEGRHRKSVRFGGGDIVGDHTVMFAKNMEILKLTHRAISRESLAEGCIQSIKWVAARKDGEVHSMSEVLGLC
ncbi:dihydrodipicolinate reductase C-terminal domain-containing protein [Methanomethylophilus alvi]|uniref:dihydrodipicolinate reductase C-terminal domain-containing protein n=1 Tax=Methanomethylophilus alvi TaxID=1291540 RepID=UPI0037DC27F5